MKIQELFPFGSVSTRVKDKQSVFASLHAILPQTRYSTDIVKAIYVGAGDLLHEIIRLPTDVTSAMAKNYLRQNTSYFLDNDKLTNFAKEYDATAVRDFFEQCVKARIIKLLDTTLFCVSHKECLYDGIDLFRDLCFNNDNPASKSVPFIPNMLGMDFNLMDKLRTVNVTGNADQIIVTMVDNTVRFSKDVDATIARLNDGSIEKWDRYKLLNEKLEFWQAVAVREQIRQIKRDILDRPLAFNKPLLKVLAVMVQPNDVSLFYKSIDKALNHLKITASDSVDADNALIDALTSINILRELGKGKLFLPAYIQDTTSIALKTIVLMNMQELIELDRSSYYGDDPRPVACC